MTLQGKQELRQHIKTRLNQLGKTQAYLSRVLRRTPQQISQALTGSQPTLLNKIENHLRLLEYKSQVNTKTEV